MRRDRSRGSWPLALLGGLLAIYLLAPLAYLIVSAGNPNLVAAIGDPVALAALQTSLLSATLSTAIIACLGVPLGYLLARRRFWGRATLGILLLVPLVFPPVVSGVLLLALFGPYGPIGAIFANAGLELDSSLVGIMLK